MVKFSIGIPAFKSNFFEECIRSILNQDYDNFELIIVDDDSPYRLGSIIDNFHDNRIRYYRNNTNIGAINVVDNWNKCLSYATGEYFICMGDDDRLSPDYLSTFLRLIQTYPNINVYHCRSFIIDENSKKISLTPSWPEWQSAYEYIWHIIGFKYHHFIGDFVFKTDNLKYIGGFYKITLAWGSDDITSFIAAINGGIVHTQKPVFHYRQNIHSITSTGSAKLKLMALKEEQQWYKQFLSKNTPQIEIDKIMRENIKKEYPSYFSKFSLWTIVESINSIKNLVEFIFTYKSYGFSKIDCVKVVIKYIQKLLKQ